MHRKNIDGASTIHMTSSSSSSISQVAKLVVLTFITTLHFHYTHAQLSCTNELSICEGGGPQYRALPGCREYVLCIGGQRINTLSCGGGQLFDVLLERCNWDYATFCAVTTCAPTDEPTYLPSAYPSATPSDSPSASPSAFPSKFIVVHIV